MIKIKRIIFVSYDDTCLGPLAESIFNRISVGYGVEAISRGVVVLFWFSACIFSLVNTSKYIFVASSLCSGNV